MLRDTGCAFVTTAVESFDDDVLAQLDKGHTRADVAAVVARCRDVGLALSPTFIAFTPWTTLDGFARFLDDVERLDLVGTRRPGADDAAAARHLGLASARARPRSTSSWPASTRRSLTYPWRHPDPAVDALQHDVMALVGVRASAPRPAVFDEVRRLSDAALGRTGRAERPRLARAAIPYLTEPWYC